MNHKTKATIASFTCKAFPSLTIGQHVMHSANEGNFFFLLSINYYELQTARGKKKPELSETGEGKTTAFRSVSSLSARFFYIQTQLVLGLMSQTQGGDQQWTLRRRQQWTNIKWSTWMMNATATFDLPVHRTISGLCVYVTVLVGLLFCCNEFWYFIECRWCLLRGLHIIKELSVIYAWERKKKCIKFHSPVKLAYFVDDRKVFYWHFSAGRLLKIDKSIFRKLNLVQFLCDCVIHIIIHFIMDKKCCRL